MKCFNCGREYDDINDKAECVLIDNETGEEAELKRITVENNHQLSLCLCRFCVRAVVFGMVYLDGSKRHTIKSFSIQDVINYSINHQRK